MQPDFIANQAGIVVPVGPDAVIEKNRFGPHLKITRFEVKPGATPIWKRVGRREHIVRMPGTTYQYLLPQAS